WTMSNGRRHHHRQQQQVPPPGSESETTPPEASADEGGTVGELETNCSEKEILDRQQTRQIDKFERAVEDFEGRPKANPSLMVKKYQRSSADKVYSASDIRTEQACYDSMMYLLENVLDFDINPKPGYHPNCQLATYFDIYSFLRDRTRAVRVDLHVQNLVHSHVFTDIHEWCLRFEILSIFRLWGRNFGEGADRKFNWQLSLNSIAQTVDPLTLSYVVQNDDREASAATVAKEAAIHRYIILILLCNGDTTRVLFYIDKLAKQQPRVFAHPNVRFALNVVNWFRVGQWSRVLQTYASSSTDFLTATALMPIAFLCRSRVLYDVVRTNRPFLLPKGEGHPARAPRPERVSLQSMQEMLFLEDPSMCAAFLQYHGCEVVDSATGIEVDPSTEEVLSSEGLECLLPPRMLRLPYRWWLSSDDWVKQTKQEVTDEWTWERRKAFTERLGENVNADGTVTRCTFPQTVDPILARKYDLVLDSGVTLKDIILGAVDPGVDGSTVIKPTWPPAPVRRPPPVGTVKFGQAAQERTAVLLPNKKAVAARANGSVFGALPRGEVPKNKSPFAAVSSTASSSPFGVTTTAASTSSGPFGKASNPFAATTTMGPFGVATGGLASASSSPFGVQPSVSAMPSPFLPLKSKSPSAPTEEPPTEVVSRPAEAAPSPKQVSPSRPAGVQSPRVAKKKAADKVPVFEGLRTKLPPESPTPTATGVVDRPAKATVTTEVREPQPQKSSAGGLSIFTPAAPTSPVAEPEAPKPVVPSFPPPTPTPSPPRAPTPAAPAELPPPPAAAPPPRSPPAPVMVSPPQSIIRDECEVFSDDELEGWGHRPRRKRRIEEPLVQVASSSSTEVEDELMMADLPDGLLD
ncbi:hypothetical protein FOZ63_025753, partial [Perkinsus olseni]